MLKSELIRSVLAVVPALAPHLRGKARWLAFEYGKTAYFFQGTVEHLVKQVYGGMMQSEFIDILANLVYGQFNQAYTFAWEEDGNTLPLPDFLASALEDAVLKQYDFIDQFYADIVSARELKQPIEPLLARCSLWSNRYDEAYNEATRLITLNTGGKLQWIEGDTDDKCETCVRLDGLVAYAYEWDEIGVRPQNAPNASLLCGGWRCNCRLEPTDRRRSPNARDRIAEAVYG